MVCGAIPHVTVLARWHALRVLDHRVGVRDVDVALLHSIPMSRPLAEATIEQLAARLTRMRVTPGALVFQQRDEGTPLTRSNEAERR